MSESATEGTQGQESGTQQEGQNGSQGQESGAGGTGQESGTEQEQGTGTETPDLSAITDPVLRGWVEAQAKAAREASRDAARYRTERNALQTKVTEAQRANETAEQTAQREAQERQNRLEEVERENRTLKVGQALTTAAVDAKAFNPARVAELLDAKVELDDDGKPTNVDKLLKDLRKTDPYLFKRAQQDGGEGNDGNGAPTGDMNDTIRGMVRGRSRTT